MGMNYENEIYIEPILDGVENGTISVREASHELAERLNEISTFHYEKVENAKVELIERWEMLADSQESSGLSDKELIKQFEDLLDDTYDWGDMIVGPMIHICFFDWGVKDKRREDY